MDIIDDLIRLEIVLTVQDFVCLYQQVDDNLLLCESNDVEEKAQLKRILKAINDAYKNS